MTLFLPWMGWDYATVKNTKLLYTLSLQLGAYGKVIENIRIF